MRELTLTEQGICLIGPRSASIFGRRLVSYPAHLFSIQKFAESNITQSPIGRLINMNVTILHNPWLRSRQN